MPLCTLAEYRRITHDATTASSDVADYIADAQEYLEFETDRQFSSASYTETLCVYPDGRVYPHATPVTAVATPAGAAFTPSAIPAGWLDDVTTVNTDDWTGRRRAVVTYTGGYADGSAPAGLVRLIAHLARHFSRETVGAALPSGVTSVSFGSQSYSGKSLGDVGALPASLRRQVRALKYRAA